MRLLNTTTLAIEEFFDGHAPPYGILSHRWLSGEVTFQEMQSGSATSKLGYAKISNVCKQASADGLGYAWVDTCCIDKTSSAELSEAINSMFRWYQCSSACYALLSDVSSPAIDSSSSEAEFAKSIWFTRGWALQELIAPTHVYFYNASWTRIGTKDSLQSLIADTTQIDPSVLQDAANIEQVSVARRMSWAARRVTTRKEDQAYCLLGLFGVNMPMLYGEGDRAFFRLQEEIMKLSDDHSLFAWSSTEPGARGLLARSPADFAGCKDVDVTQARWNKKPFAVSNLGLSIQLLMLPWAMDTYFAALDCARAGQRLGIFVRMLPREQRYARVVVGGEDVRAWEARMTAHSAYRDMYVQQRVWGQALVGERFYGFWLRTVFAARGGVPPLHRGEEALGDVMAHGVWDGEKRLLEIPTGQSGTAGVMCVRRDGKATTLKLGMDDEFNPRVQIGGMLASPDAKDSYSFAGRMDPSWMDAPARSMYLHKGDRMMGLLKDGHPWSISIQEGFIPGTKKRGFILDIDRGHHAGVVCDKCNTHIYGNRYKCKVCADFDFCEKCFKSSGVEHTHAFDKIGKKLSM